MDSSWLMRKSSQRPGTISTFHNNPFPCRPWFTDTGAASAAGSSSGFKGVIAGRRFIFTFFFFVIIS